MSPPAPTAVRLADYRPPDFLIDQIELVFDLREKATRVKSRLKLRRNPASVDGDAPLILDGERLTLVRLALEGESLGENRYALEPGRLTIREVPDAFTLDVETEIDPAANTALEGLYLSKGNFFTQCEAEGFRRITYYIDRPDVMARFTTTLIAEKARAPVLLSNGNPLGGGELDGGRHWAKWEDPFPKPSYLFALVAGDFAVREDSFTTRSGRKIPLRIHVAADELEKCGHAMVSLKKAMRWDEEVYGREYDLDVFMIVAVADYNMGAMENKGLNVFNTKYVLAQPETATDTDFLNIEGVVGHEYFHNWTGDRVTCRDWFQLSLKEGLTVFRDQEFSADMGSRAVKRIADVRRLRATQFSEDAGPTAHPIRPESYIEINNFYTPTVYEKGAEVVRMIHTLLGAKGFAKGMDLYFERHDGQAVTCEDFVKAMEDANGADLAQFRRWYSQAGTPEIDVAERYDPDARSYELSVTQRTPPTPGQPDKQPLHIPFAVGLVDGEGRDMSVRLDGEDAPSTGTRVLALKEATQTFRFHDVAEAPRPSLLRAFSAPVKLTSQPRERLKFLYARDTDSFARWEAGQQLASQLLLEMVGGVQGGLSVALDPDFITAFAATLALHANDPAFTAEALTLPSEAFLADQMAIVDVEAIHAAREGARQSLAAALGKELEAAYEANRDDGTFSIEPKAMGRRALKNLCLAYLAADVRRAGIVERLAEQARNATTMTDSLAALALLADIDGSEREVALAAFYARWRDEALVIDKWFAIQARSHLPGTLGAVRKLVKHPAFTYRTPNRVYALILAFAGDNQLRFNAADGSGYAFLADQVLIVDPANPQLAARLVKPLARWRRHEPKRQTLMTAALERILAKAGLSRDVYELVSKSLA